VAEYVITGQPNGPVLFCSLASVIVGNAAGGQAGRTGGQAVGHSTAGQYRYVTLGRHVVLYTCTCWKQFISGHQ